ncbi:MAG: PrsW family intramembrane metalloprotease [Gloeocapsa sp. DLM2.Bin57]|nr:MAG: PrsW family intramembrane metalloprotease [Gloeocapsa sp. DLM2.Bin57]
MNAYITPKKPHQIIGGQAIDYPLSTDRSLCIGRDASKCEIVIDSNVCQTVSRVHVEIRPVNYPTTQQVVSWEVYDHSSNGTFVNNVRLQGSQILTPGDIIKLSQDGPEFVFNNLLQSLRTNNNNNNEALRLTQLVPILSKKNNLFNKGFLIPGILTCFFIVSLFFVINNPVLFNILLGTYIITLAYYFIYRLCGKHKPWWLLLGVAIAEIIILVSPLLIIFIIIFRGVLPGGIEQNNFASAFIANFFGAGLMEELLKALPAFVLIWFSSILRSPWRERIGIWEPLDGILIVAAAGAGFTFIETLGQYVPMMIEQGGHLAGLQLLIPRTLGSITGHMAYSGYFGYFIGLSMLKPSKRRSLLLIGWLTSSVLHGFWNAAASVSNNILIVYSFLAFSGILSYVFLIAAILKARQLSPNRTENFATQFRNLN